jgi:hypothetical protein
LRYFRGQQPSFFESVTAMRLSVTRRTLLRLLAGTGLVPGTALTSSTVPPMVHLAVLSETRSLEGIDYFGAGLDDLLLEHYREWGTAEGHMGELKDVLAPALSSTNRPKSHWL